MGLSNPFFMKRSGAMSMSEREKRTEQERVNQTIREIDKRMDKLQKSAASLKGDIVDIGRNFWSDVTVNIDEPDEAAETYVSIKQQAELLSERERSHKNAHKQLQALGKLKQSPYFGRIDFVEDGEEKKERIYIGTSSLLDDQQEEFLIYD
jgi:DNA helicase II / ATP-dependent DNA helicase PcrA